MTKRIEYIDIARGMAMLLVILGHCFTSVDATLNKFILSFHMPLFFFLSGFTCNRLESKCLNLLMGGGKK